ncbi:hypothetical protein RRG08_049169 [Elysia crispata]|uniref:Uncharacterized protein n=1 Tax=Elysia crispata TaxID=231223 RepID=A0AAE1AR25_9GAST|nr:hypothetical protein RRG08_049169 [Elysia crispata]
MFTLLRNIDRVGSGSCEPQVNSHPESLGQWPGDEQAVGLSGTDRSLDCRARPTMFLVSKIPRAESEVETGWRGGQTLHRQTRSPSHHEQCPRHVPTRTRHRQSKETLLHLIPVEMSMFVQCAGESTPGSLSDQWTSLRGNHRLYPRRDSSQYGHTMVLVQPGASRFPF